MENLSPNHAQIFLPYKYTDFTMGGTVALQSFRRATVLQLPIDKAKYLLILYEAIYSHRLTLTCGYKQDKTTRVLHTRVEHIFGTEPPAT